MFEKLVAIEPLNVSAAWIKRFGHYAKSFTYYEDRPRDNAEIIRRIGDADGVLVSFTTDIDREVLRACKNIRYIGMCCSLYAPENANVDIEAANEQGIVVKGVRDYGDEGVAEFVVSELVRLLHGFGENIWKNHPMELTGVPVGILGIGTTGQIIARALMHFGADVSYFSRTRKPAFEKETGCAYLPFEELLQNADILCTCLNRNAILMDEKAFSLFGNGKILVNTSIAPSHEIPALENWLGNDNWLIADTAAAVDYDGGLLAHSRVICPRQSAGLSTLSLERLGKKVVENMVEYLEIAGK